MCLFRVVSEAHSCTIRNNTEWQEKLPRVVLKAEEIMYSKANSEAEYVDADTLWDRLNDAINTIIRRGESTELVQFLQPCIKAALVLGCTPVRASRSHRHVNTGSYINPSFQEPAQASPIISDIVNNHEPFPQAPTLSSNQLSTTRSEMANQASSSSICSSQTGPVVEYIANQTSPQYHYHQSFPRPMPSVVTNTKSSLNLGSIYPLYHGSYFPFRLHSAQISNVDKIIIGRPIGWPPRARPTCLSSMRNVLTDESIRVAGYKTDQVNPIVGHGNSIATGCDLSLRLGPSDCSISSGRHLSRVSNAGGSSSHQEMNKYAKPCASDPSKSCANMMEQEVFEKKINSKRKAGDHHRLGDRNTQWLSNLYNQFDGRSRRPGW
ncbi:hypothetical protein RND81_07G109900 [Saponaria officinalis]|uniref:Histone acetyltransferase n=1 Tax=Saponaria officinalis TaxID=3572 RepID=A0AAW1JQ02_SAPOF